MSLRVLCAVALVVALPSQLPAVAPFSSPSAPHVQKLLRQLDHEDFHVRQRADDELRSLGTTVRSYVTAELGRTRSLEVRWRLGRILQEMSLDERVEVLVRLLGNKNSLAQDRAEWALRQSGPAVVPLLRNVMKLDPSAAQRQRVQKIIAEFTQVVP